MAEVTNQAVEAMPARLSGIEHESGEVDARMFSMSGRSGGLSSDVGCAHADIANIYQSLGQMDGRPIGIGRRLELLDQSAE